MPWLYTGRVIREGKGWIDSDGNQHPRNWGIWSDEEKTDRGMVWQDEPASYDSRYYWDADTAKSLNDVTETVDGESIITPGLKTSHIAKTREISNSLLAPTDWYVIRKSERAIAIPTDIANHRSAILDHCSDIIAAITAASDMDDFIAIYTDTEDGGVITVGVGNNWPTLED